MRTGSEKQRLSESRISLAALLLAACCAFPETSAHAQEGSFKPARAGWDFQFPRDHGSHEDFRTEWWYFTGHLTTASGREAGFEVTFFRVGVRRPAAPPTSRWELRDLGIAHFAVTDLASKQFRFYEKINRLSPFTAGAAPNRMDVFNESWRATMDAAGVIRLRASGAEDSLDLSLVSRKPPAVHGENGVSVKAEGEGYASHYYSLSRMDVTGSAVIGGRRETVTGLGWLDREFGSAVLREYQTGWDWFAIQLDNGVELMLYVIRRSDGTPDETSSGSMILQDGRVIPLKRDAFAIESTGSWTSKNSGATYPMGWRVRIPGFGVDLRVRERMREQELITESSTRITYWEGAVVVDGRFGTSAARGLGYVEMTGYAEPFTMDQP